MIDPTLKTAGLRFGESTFGKLMTLGFLAPSSSRTRSAAVAWGSP